MRRTLSMLLLTAALSAGATGCVLFRDDGAPAASSQGTATAGTSDAGGSAGAAEGSAPAAGAPVLLEETIAESSLDADGGTLTFALKGVTANSAGAVVHGVLSSTGPEPIQLALHDPELLPEGVPILGSAAQLNSLTITDAATGNVHTPAYTADGACLCTEHSPFMEPGESLPVFAQFAPLAEGTASVTVTFGQLGAFADVPVTWT